MPDDLDAAFEALARAEGKTVEELKRELLRNRLGGAAPAARPTQALARSGTEMARERREREEFGSPVVRSRRDTEESPEDAEERWLAEEADLVDGVHGIGGSTGGGIFGGGPIATPVYDPEAHHRGSRHTASELQIRQTQQMTELIGQVGELAERISAQLPPASGRGLLGGARRLLGRRK